MWLLALLYFAPSSFGFLFKPSTFVDNVIVYDKLAYASVQFGISNQQLSDVIDSFVKAQNDLYHTFLALGAGSDTIAQADAIATNYRAHSTAYEELRGLELQFLISAPFLSDYYVACPVATVKIYCRPGETVPSAIGGGGSTTPTTTTTTKKPPILYPYWSFCADDDTRPYNYFEKRNGDDEYVLVTSHDPDCCSRLVPIPRGCCTTSTETCTTSTGTIVHHSKTSLTSVGGGVMSWLCYNYLSLLGMECEADSADVLKALGDRIDIDESKILQLFDLVQQVQDGTNKALTEQAKVIQQFMSETKAQFVALTNSINSLSESLTSTIIPAILSLDATVNFISTYETVSERLISTRQFYQNNLLSVGFSINSASLALSQFGQAIMDAKASALIPGYNRFVVKSVNLASTVSLVIELVCLHDAIAPLTLLRTSSYMFNLNNTNFLVIPPPFVACYDSKFCSADLAAGCLSVSGYELCSHDQYTAANAMTFQVVPTALQMARPYIVWDPSSVLFVANSSYKSASVDHLVYPGTLLAGTDAVTSIVSGIGFTPQQVSYVGINGVIYNDPISAYLTYKLATMYGGVNYGTDLANAFSRNFTSLSDLIESSKSDIMSLTSQLSSYASTIQAFDQALPTIQNFPALTQQVSDQDLRLNQVQADLVSERSSVQASLDNYSARVDKFETDYASSLDYLSTVNISALSRQASDSFAIAQAAYNQALKSYESSRGLTWLDWFIIVILILIVLYLFFKCVYPKYKSV